MEPTDEHSEARKSRNCLQLVIAISVFLLLGLFASLWLWEGPLPPMVTLPPANDATASAAVSFQTYIAQTRRADTDDDRDALSIARELELGTDPNNPDTDGDGLRDGHEVLIWGTNPTLRDTDGDGLRDGDEVNIYRTDPNNPDTDGDGVNDATEVRLGTNPLLTAATPTLILTAHPNDCTGSPSPSRVVRIPMTMHVVDMPNRIREAPDPGATMITLPPPGSLFSVIGGPICDTSQFLRWWQVEWEDVTGWMVEGVGDRYFVEDPNATAEPE